MTPRTIVVGGGIAGLLAARRHAARGEHVTLIEAGPVLGGAVAEDEIAGVALSTGAEAFSVTSGAVEELLAELGLADAVVSPTAGRGSRLVSDAGSLPSPRGGLLGIPGRPLSREARAVLGAAGAVRAWAERLLPAGFALTPGVTIGEYVRRRMGPRVAERLVAPVVGGVHSADPSALELAAIQPRLAAAVREHGSLAAAVRALRPARASAGTAVRSLAPTMAALPAALERDLHAQGVAIRTACPVTGIERDGEGWEVSFGAEHEPGGAPEALRAEALVLATPPDVTARLLAEAAPEIAAAIPDAPSASVRLVALVLDAPALDDAPSGTGALVAPGTAAVRAKALTHASAKWDHVRAAAVRAVGPHGHVVRLSYGRPGEELPADDTALEETGGTSALVDRALADASAILRTPLTREHLRGAGAITWARAMRQARPGHRQAVARLDELLAAHAPPGAPGALELVGAWRDGTGLDAIAAAERGRSAAPPAASPDTIRPSTPTEGPHR